MDRPLSPASQRGAVNPIAAIATIGAILIALGVGWFFISNWHQFSRAVKILLLLGATGSSFAASLLLERRGYARTGQAGYLLTALLWTLSVFIIAQQFHYGNSLQENTNLLAVATLGAATIAYLLQSVASLFLALALFYGWAFLQAAAYGLDFAGATLKPGFSPVMVALGIALFYFGLGLVHRSRDSRHFAKVYTWFASGLILLLGFIFTHQTYQPLLAIPLESLRSWYTVFFILIPIITAGMGIQIVLAKGNLSSFDAYSGPIIWMLYVLSAILLPLLLGTGRPAASLPGWYGSVWQMGPAFLIQWLYFNAIFIALMLYVVDFAARERRVALMNLALYTFGLYIFVRYVGFMLDLQGYLPLSLMLILGGIGLIVLSMGYQKFRKFTRGKVA